MRLFLLAFYREVQRKLIGPWVANRRFGNTRNHETLGTFGVKGHEEKQATKLITSPSRSEDSISIKNGEKLWFHAASVGELEALWPLIRLAATKGKSLVLTIFSPSAESSLKKLVQELATLPEQNFSLDWGYSPWEGDWCKYLNQYQPTLFITHKYEAWPDLWLSLTQLEIPLVIVGSSFRASLKTAKKFCLALLKRTPKLQLLPFNQTQAVKLSNSFPNAQITVIRDPRWERVLGRVRAGNARSKELIHSYAPHGTIKGIIGSAWLEDLQFLKPILKDLDGPIWIVPHQVDESSVAELEIFLRTLGMTSRRTKLSEQRRTEVSPKVAPKEFIMVNEMGVLAELYAVAEWAFVGGGFGSGVHSTIEPAIHGLPIGIGPNGANKFYEIEEMTHTGQVTVLNKNEDLQEWVRKLKARDFFPSRSLWRQHALAHAGASEKIFEAVENFK